LNISLSFLIDAAFLRALKLVERAAPDERNFVKKGVNWALRSVGKVAAVSVGVVDGLRPDYVTPDVMPRLVQLGRRGIVFNAHHAVFPTVTRVNASSFATGAYPETHGLLGNTIYIPSVKATGLDTGERANLESVARAEGELLTAPTLGEILQRGGRKVLAVSSGSSGSALLLNHKVNGGAIIHHDFTQPAELEKRVLEGLGPVPPAATPNDRRNQRAIDAYLKIGLDTIHPDVTLMWLNDPDGTAHANGHRDAAGPGRGGRWPVRPPAG
jgi:hypothetical protein